MTSALYAVTNTVIGIVFLILLLGLGVYGVLRTNGRTRVLLEVGIGLLLLSRLASMAFYAFAQQMPHSSTAEVLLRNIVQGAISQAISFAGLVFLVLAAIYACDQLRRRHSASAGQHVVEGGYPAAPGYGQVPPGGYPQQRAWPQAQPQFQSQAQAPYQAQPQAQAPYQAQPQAQAHGHHQMHSQNQGQGQSEAQPQPHAQEQSEAKPWPWKPPESSEPPR